MVKNVQQLCKEISEKYKEIRATQDVLDDLMQEKNRLQAQMSYQIMMYFRRHSIYDVEITQDDYSNTERSYTIKTTKCDIDIQKICDDLELFFCSEESTDGRLVFRKYLM